MEQPKHCKVVDYQSLPDGSLEITTKSYYERLAHLMQEIQKNIDTTMSTLDQDVLTQIKHFKDGAPELVLTLKMVNGKPRLTKRYVTLKKNFPRI
jgi:hypothetical protein